MDFKELKRLEELVRIWTAYDAFGSSSLAERGMREFHLHKKAIRRRIVAGKQHGRWIKLVSGEWSQTPWNQGKRNFCISYSDDKMAWALLSVAFPSRIIAVATSSCPMTVEEAGALMLRQVQRAGGEYIDDLDENGDIDIDRFLSIYWFEK